MSGEARIVSGAFLINSSLIIFLNDFFTIEPARERERVAYGRIRDIKNDKGLNTPPPKIRLILGWSLSCSESRKRELWNDNAKCVFNKIKTYLYIAWAIYWATRVMQGPVWSAVALHILGIITHRDQKWAFSASRHSQPHDGYVELNFAKINYRQRPIKTV